MWTVTNGYMLAMPWTSGDGGLAHYKASLICPTFWVGDRTPTKDKMDIAYASPFLILICLKINLISATQLSKLFSPPYQIHISLPPTLK